MVGNVATSLLKSVYSSCVDFLAPPVCLHCGRDLLSETNVSQTYCARCLPQLPVRSLNACLRCGAPLGAFQSNSAGCPHCRGSRFSFSGVVSLGAYEGALKDSCQRGKSPGSQPVIASLTEKLIKFHGDQLTSWQCSAVISVPTFWRARLRRRIHPNETMAEEFSRFLRIPQRRNWLRQVRKTRQQHLLPPAERRKNVRGAYSVHRATGLQGARVLLVDDILTTGSTAQVCTRALLEAGAAEVFVAVLARGLKPR